MSDAPCLEKGLRDVGKLVRERAERLQQERPERFPADLAGLCMVASAWSFLTLSGLGLKPKFAVAKPSWRIYGNSEHVFVVVDGLLLDVTATQFGMPAKVCVRPVGAKRTPSYWKIVATADSLEDLKTLLLKRGWKLEDTKKLDPKLYEALVSE